MIIFKCNGVECVWFNWHCHDDHQKFMEFMETVLNGQLSQ